jgi:hypothetical protein
MVMDTTTRLKLVLGDQVMQILELTRQIEDLKTQLEAVKSAPPGKNKQGKGGEG